MIKILPLISFLFLGLLNGMAQIVITTADMSIAGKAVFQANDTLPAISIGNPGSNQTWSITALVQHTIDTARTMPYSSAPNAKFSTANLVVQQGPDNFYGYLLNSSSNMLFLGGSGVIDIQGTPTTINQINTPAERVFNFPTSYDSSFVDSFATSAKFYFGQTIQGLMIDSIHQQSGVHKTFLVDAWGTLTTPLAGGPYNVLRIKETTISNDTTKAYVFGGWNDIPGGITADSTTTYSWWTNGIGVPLITVTMDSSGVAENVQWLTALPSSTVSINEQVYDNNFTIYPNPSTNSITIQYDALSSAANSSPELLIEIKNELGQSIKETRLKQFVKSKNEIVFDISDLPGGIYFVQIKNGQTTVNKKFIKQ